MHTTRAPGGCWTYSKDYSLSRFPFTKAGVDQNKQSIRAHHCSDHSRKIRAAEPCCFLRNFFSWVCTHHAPLTHLMKQGSSSYFLPGPIYLPTKSPCQSPGTQPMLSPTQTLTSVLASSVKGLGLLLFCCLVLCILHVSMGLFWKPLYLLWCAHPWLGQLFLLWVSTAPHVIPTITLMTT